MKHKRHLRILEIIEKWDIQTQEELAEMLHASGFEVTQATVSRDIKDLRLVKITGEKGETKYMAQKETKHLISERLMTVLKQSFISSDCAGNILVIKTLPGMAQAAASAIDNLGFEGIIGTIAGDDTIFSVTKSPEEAKNTMLYFKNELRDIH
ncbi:MAG: arginine repressor [Clostridia bacterium]